MDTDIQERGTGIQRIQEIQRIQGYKDPDTVGIYREYKDTDTRGTCRDKRVRIQE